MRQRPVGPVDTAPPETQPPDTSPPDTEPPAPLVDPPPETFYYPDCDTAKAEGAAPLYYGYEGYWSALDPDHDGVACDT